MNEIVFIRVMIILFLILDNSKHKLDKKVKTEQIHHMTITFTAMYHNAGNYTSCNESGLSFLFHASH